MKNDIPFILFLAVWFVYVVGLFIVFDINSLALKLFGFAGILVLLFLARCNMD